MLEDGHIDLRRRSCLICARIGVRVGVAAGRGSVAAGVPDPRFGISRFGEKSGQDKPGPWAAMAADGDQDKNAEVPAVMRAHRTRRARRSGEGPMSFSCALTGCLLQGIEGGVS
jgi:hypothetical protein